MEVSRFFCPDLCVQDMEVASGALTLSPEESHHAVKVLRLAEGSKVELINGNGRVVQGVIEHADPRHTLVGIRGSGPGPDARPGIHIAVAPPKNINRLEWFLEKATEIGIATVIPMQCARSERLRLNTERLERVIIAALKQSKRSWKPELLPPTPFQEVLRQHPDGHRYLAWLGEASKPLKQLARPGQASLVLIGPEGDFTESEVTEAQAAGFDCVTLGSARLRTETAALYACAILNMIHE